MNVKAKLKIILATILITTIVSTSALSTDIVHSINTGQTVQYLTENSLSNENISSNIKNPNKNEKSDSDKDSDVDTNTPGLSTGKISKPNTTGITNVPGKSKILAKVEAEKKKNNKVNTKKNTKDSDTDTNTKNEKYTDIYTKDIKANAESVSSIKVTWSAEKDREYEVEVFTKAPYLENIFFVFKEKGTCYLTGLRENSEYEITVTPILTEKEEKDTSKEYNVHSAKITTNTLSAGEVIQEYEHEDGWTNCFAGERASGLTAMPSSGAIYGSKVDQITGTGIRRFENGDYCCAMGEWYGECGDRFLVELENGIQFTTRICDSKGWADDADGDGTPDGRFHWFGGTGNGKCVIEFIWDDGNLPADVAYSGSWGYWNWNGLDLGANIKSIQKLATY